MLQNCPEYTDPTVSLKDLSVIDSVPLGLHHPVSVAQHDPLLLPPSGQLCHLQDYQEEDIAAPELFLQREERSLCCQDSHHYCHCLRQLPQHQDNHQSSRAPSCLSR